MSNTFIVAAMLSLGIATAAIFVTIAVFGPQPDDVIAFGLVTAVPTALLSLRIVKSHLGD